MSLQIDSVSDPSQQLAFDSALVVGGHETLLAIGILLTKMYPAENVADDIIPAED